MAKTNPVGVRFREDVLEKLKADHGIDAPQKALIFLEAFYLEHSLSKKEISQIEKKRNTRANIPTRNVLTEDEAIPINDAERQAIHNQIAAIEAEKIPAERNTALGRRAWVIERNQRIAELKNKLK